MAPPSTDTTARLRGRAAPGSLGSDKLPSAPRSWRIPMSACLMAYLTVLIVIPVSDYRFPVRLPMDLEPQRLVLLGIALLWVAALLVDRSVRMPQTGLGVPLLLLGSTALISLVVNAPAMSDGFAAVKSLVLLLSFFLVSLVAAAAVTDAVAARRIIRWLVIAGSIIAVFAFVERVTEVNIFRHIDRVFPLLENQAAGELAEQLVRGGGVRVSGSSEHPIAFGALMTVLVPLAIYRFVEARTARQRLVTGSSAALIGAAAMLSGSRTVVIGLLAAMAMLLWDQPRLRVALLLWGFIGLFAIHMVFPGALGGFRATLDPTFIQARELDNPGHGRGAAYPVVYRSFQAHPALGVGYGQWQPYDYAFTDNQYLQIVAELGLIGLASYVMLLGWSILQPWIRRKGSADRALMAALAASCASYAAMSLAFDALAFIQATYLFFALAGMGGALAVQASRTGTPLEGAAVWDAR